MPLDPGVEPPADAAPLRSAIRDLATFDWIVFTSANGVDWFWTALERESLDSPGASAPRGSRASAPGRPRPWPGGGFGPTWCPTRTSPRHCSTRWTGPAELPGTRILLPRAARGRPVLPDGLRARGAEVVEVEAYRTVPETARTAELRSWIAAGAIDALTFTSSSTVASFVDAVGTETGRALVAAIGPITAETARALGLPVHVEATDHTCSGWPRHSPGAPSRSATPAEGYEICYACPASPRRPRTGGPRRGSPVRAAASSLPAMRRRPGSSSQRDESMSEGNAVATGPILRRIEAREAVCGVMGLGYVGLPPGRRGGEGGVPCPGF